MWFAVQRSKNIFRPAPWYFLNEKGYGANAFGGFERGLDRRLVQIGDAGPIVDQDAMTLVLALVTTSPETC